MTLNFFVFFVNVTEQVVAFEVSTGGMPSPSCAPKQYDQVAVVRIWIRDLRIQKRPLFLLTILPRQYGQEVEIYRPIHRNIKIIWQGERVFRRRANCRSIFVSTHYGDKWDRTVPKNRLQNNTVSPQTCGPLSKGPHRGFILTAAVPGNWLHLFPSVSWSWQQQNRKIIKT